MSGGIEFIEGEEVWYVNEYETNRAYGGPEEGGWWYNCGIFIRCRGIYTKRVEAYALRRRIMEEEIPRLRKGLHEPGSILCEGWPDVFIDEKPGRDYPREVPRYE